MGDNRSQSADSRVHLGDPGGGFVPEQDVVGKVFAVVWPVGHFKVVTRPDTFDSVPDPGANHKHARSSG
jgi:signal peptidase I